MLPYLYASQWQFMIYIPGEIWCPTSPDTCTTHVSLVKLFKSGHCKRWWFFKGLAERSCVFENANTFLPIITQSSLTKANVSVYVLTIPYKCYHFGIAYSSFTALLLYLYATISHSIKLPYPSSPAMHFSCLWSVKKTHWTRQHFFSKLKKSCRREMFIEMCWKWGIG